MFFILNLTQRSAGACFWAIGSSDLLSLIFGFISNPWYTWHNCIHRFFSKVLCRQGGEHSAVPFPRVVSFCGKTWDRAIRPCQRNTCSHIDRQLWNPRSAGSWVGEVQKPLWQKQDLRHRPSLVWELEGASRINERCDHDRFQIEIECACLCMHSIPLCCHP